MKINVSALPRRARLEIVPLIDVIFLLLTFFIYVSLWMTLIHGVPVRLPGGVAEPDLRPAWVITLCADGSLWIGTRSVTIAEAVEAAVREAGSGRPVLLRGDRRADLGPAVELLSRLRAAGVRHVSFQIRPQP